jgi:hypothetical protein
LEQQNKEGPQKENSNEKSADAENTNTKRTSYRLANDRNNSGKVLISHKRHADENEETSHSYRIKRQSTKFTLLKEQNTEAQATTQLNNDNNNNNKDNESENSFISQETLATIPQSTYLEKNDREEKEERNLDSMKEGSAPGSESNKVNTLHESGIRRVYIHQRQRHSLFDVNELIKNNSVETLGWDMKS